jgi:antitoxin HicB
MLLYPAHFGGDNPEGGYVVTFPDFPEAVTQGETLDEAIEMARDSLRMAIPYRIATTESVPLPSKRKGKDIRLVGLSALQAAKLALYQLWRESGIRKVELARRLGIPPPNVDRLFHFDRATQVDQLEAAFAALGKRLVIGVEDAA